MKFARAAGIVALALVYTACGGGDKSVVEPPAEGLASVSASIVDPQIEIGQGTNAQVAGKDAQGAPFALGSRTVTWRSSNTAIVTITDAGAVNAIGVGNVTLTVTVQNGSGTLTATTPLVVTPVADAPTTADVAMAPQLFIPSQTVVKLNGTVRFQFTPIDHNVIWNPRLAGSPADILVTTNQLVSRVFTTVGVYGFDCTVHPGMSGRIIVSP